ncbi:hypothetical protein FB451DRAFT_1163402 [Mycena latifolia]|nr:hypothetical protein FB451DRAFT_1163402 [Mycena latifolia]
MPALSCMFLCLSFGVFCTILWPGSSPNGQAEQPGNTSCIILDVEHGDVRWQLQSGNLQPSSRDDLPDLVVLAVLLRFADLHGCGDAYLTAEKQIRLRHMQSTAETRYNHHCGLFSPRQGWS